MGGACAAGGDAPPGATRPEEPSRLKVRSRLSSVDTLLHYVRDTALGVRKSSRLMAVAVLMMTLGFPMSAHAATEQVQLGCLNLLVSDSWTAQVFHVVDQLSEWDQFVHRQYVRWGARTLNLTDEDRAPLKQHASLRT